MAQRRDRRTADARPREWQFLTPLALGSMLNPVNSSMIATALVPIGGDLGISPGRTAVLVSVLYLVCAVAQPTLGRIGEVFGARRVFLIGSALVAVFGVVGALGTSLGMLVLARVFIGVGTSAAFPNAMLIIRARQQREEGWDPRPSLGVMTVAAQVTTAAGLPIGGLLVELAGWRAVFLFNVPVVALCLTMTMLWIPRDERAPLRPGAALTRIDPIGVVLFTATIGGLLAAMQTLGRVTWTALTVSVIGLVVLLCWERRASSPFIDVRSLARNGALTRTYLRTGLTYGTTYTMMYAYTQWMQEGRGLDAWVAGLVMVPMTGVAAALSWLLSRRGLIRPSLRVAAVAVTVTAAGLILLRDDTPIPFLLLAAFGFGIVLGGMSTGNQNALYAQAPACDLGTSSGLYRTATYLGAIGSSALTAVAYADGVDDGGFRIISIALVIVGLAVSVLTFADRTLARTTHDPPQDAGVRS
ncbi:MFS transporter [Actinomadura rugatobispora]|uniref:MFS transporter n=1 Tax=Actinomadura rugatobispora TaxID=1994 RepID=A0ABW0ZPY1_9ACTN|nr:MFS transporter [Actinomadura rugatobispora]